MTDEQINQLFDLKQKLDAGAITQEVFDKEVTVLKGEASMVASANVLPSEKVEKLQQLKTLFDDGLISLEEMDKLRNEIINEKPAITPTPPMAETKKSGFNWWIVVGAVALVAIIVILAVVNSDNTSVESTGEATDDEYYTEVATVQQEEPVYQEPEWTPSCGEWIMDGHSALLRLSYNSQPVFVRYYPGDRFELSAPDLGMNDLCFKIKDSNGKKVSIATSTQHHIQGSERVEIDDPASVKKLYRMLEQGNFTIQPAWLIDVKVRNEGCGLAEFVWHKFTERDPYTNEILGKSTSNCDYTSGSRVYDADPKNGLGSDEALELIIRSELGDEDATNKLEEELGNELQRLITQ